MNLEVSTSEINKIKELLNEINATYRVGEKNEDGSLTSLKFKTQEDLDKAIEAIEALNKN